MSPLSLWMNVDESIRNQYSMTTFVPHQLKWDDQCGT